MTWNNESVVPKPKSSKRDAILDIAAERGFQDAPMSLVAERSGASAGVIYHHFASKKRVRIYVAVTKDRDSFRERTDTYAEGAFDNARLAADVLGEVENGRLTLRDARITSNSHDGCVSCL